MYIYFSLIGKKEAYMLDVTAVQYKELNIGDKINIQDAASAKEKGYTGRYVILDKEYVFDSSANTMISNYLITEDTSFSEKIDKVLDLM